MLERTRLIQQQTECLSPEPVKTDTASRTPQNQNNSDIENQPKINGQIEQQSTSSASGISSPSTNSREDNEK